MSTTNSLHYKLCIEGGNWLHRQKWNYERCRKKPCYVLGVCGECCKRCKYVAVELCTWGSENTDVWGLGNFNDSAVIEVKVSRSDFKADQKKWARSKQAEALNLQAGRYRWYLCPEGVIKPEELPDKWGLLYWDGKKIRPIVPPKAFDNTSKADMGILTSILTREKFPQKVYNYRVARSTIQPQTVNGVSIREWEKQQED